MMLFSLKSLVFNLQDKKMFSILKCGMNNWHISYKRRSINLIIVAILLKIKKVLHGFGSSATTIVLCSTLTG